VRGQLSPGTLRVLGAALVHERATGKPFGHSAIRRLCAAEGGSVGACLVVIKGMANGPDGWAVNVNDPDAVIEAEDRDTEIALKARKDVRATIE
jgi:hypothetical protein